MAKRKKPRFTAATADKWDLYERSVQEPDADIDLHDVVRVQQWFGMP